MELAYRWGDRNLGKLELVIVLLIFSVVIGLFTQYALNIFSRAEQNMINSTVMNVNTALHYRAALMLMRNEYQDLRKLEMLNPMEEFNVRDEKISLDGDINNMAVSLLASTAYISANYGGEINSYTMESMEEGVWYFNQDNRHLIYKVRNNEFFTNYDGTDSILEFKIIFDYVDKNINGEYEPDMDEFKSIKLTPLENYKWQH